MELPDSDEVGTLNSNMELDFIHAMNSLNESRSNFDLPFHDPYIDSDINCLFYDELNFLNKFNSYRDSIILNANIQSLQSKYNKLRDFVVSLGTNNIPVEIISLQEIWSVHDVDLYDLPGFQKLIFKVRDKSRGGGVGFYVKSGLNYYINNDFSAFHERIFESICIDVEFKAGKKNRFVNIYRPPGNHPFLSQSDQLAAFFMEFTSLLSRLSLDATETYILMDSNIDLLNISGNPASLNLLELCLSNGFLNIVTKATRTSQNRFSLIDQIFTNSNSSKYMSGVILNDISDHFFTFSSLNSSKSIQKPKLKTSRKFNDQNIAMFKNNLTNFSWDHLFEIDDAEMAFDSFWDSFNALFNLHFPICRVVFNRNFHKIQGFMTKGLLTSRRNKLRLLTVSVSCPSAENKNIYKKYRNMYNNLVRINKKSYFETNLNDHKNNPKKAWKFLNESINRVNKKSDNFDKITLTDEVVTDSPKIANAFNSYFSEIPTKISESIPETCVLASSYLSDSETSFEIGECDILIIEELINSLESKDTQDIYNLSSSFLKNISKCLAKPLAFIFNLSFKTGVFPSKLKVSRTVPVYKTGKKDILNNYRPISCLPILSKIIEKFVTKRLYEYLDTNHLLYKHQYGFQSGRSTLHPLLHIVDFISKALNDNEIVVAVFLDLQKAFDLVNHDILLLKLKKMGVRGSSLKWFESYLKNRKQFVMINGAFSEFFKLLNIGVPQGSILGPLLFLCFINDMFKSNSLLNFLFADDTSALCRGSDIHFLCNFVNIELQKLGVWLRANKLSINTDKTKIMIFHSKGKHVPDVVFKFDNNDSDTLSNPSLVFPIERITNKSKVPAFKILGVYLDENLTFDFHFKSITSKVSKSLFSLKNAKHILTSSALKYLYYALIHPHFLYCLPIISCTSQKNVNLLFKKQKIAIRLITKSKYNAHTQLLFYSTGILPLPELILQQTLQFMHLFNHSLLPSFFDELFVRNATLNGNLYFMRHLNDFYVPEVRTEFLRRFPFNSFPTAGNFLSSEFKEKSQRSIFKQSLKAKLLDNLKDFHIWSKS